MLKLVIIGHGDFASGLHSSLKMIAGEQPQVIDISFTEGMSLKDYKESIESTISLGLKEYQGVIVLADLKGGTPYNMATLYSNDLDKVEVISGANLAMLIEATLMSQTFDDARQLAEKLVNIGQESIGIADLSQENEKDSIEEGDGI